MVPEICRRAFDVASCRPEIVALVAVLLQAGAESVATQVLNYYKRITSTPLSSANGYL
jgi:hypothetical protein